MDKSNSFEIEFLRLAADMLRCRFHVVNGRPCTKVRWVQYTDRPMDHVMCYVGYSDSREEMRLLCAERLQWLLNS